MKRTLIMAAIAICAGTALASKPIQLSLTPDVAIHSTDVEIRGLSLNIWGENPQTGVAIGFANGSTGDSKGFQYGLIINYAENYKGVMWGTVNYVKGDFTGWQSAFVNYTAGTATGLQSGFVNYAGTLRGLQWGFFNYAAACDNGVQLGLVNVIDQNDVWFREFPDALAPAMVFVNWRF